MTKGRSILLFDLDDTITKAYQEISPEMEECLLECLDRGFTLGIVSGSDMPKVERQVGKEFLKNFEYVFTENGTQVYHNGVLIHSESIVEALPDPLLNEIFNFCLRYIADLDIPVKRGCFVECRRALINISPIGRNCNFNERVAFNELDARLKIRETMVNELTKRFAGSEPPLEFSIGGKISLDCFPRGWSKVYALKFLDFDEIHFFGDMTHPGGNDHELFEHERVTGYTVADCNDTLRQLRMFLSKL